MNKIMKIVVLLFIFYGWSIFNETIYNQYLDCPVEQIIYHLQGFEGFDKKCMGWLLIHMPVQMVLSFKMTRYLQTFSIYHYMKKGSISKLWLEVIVITARSAFLYYFCGIMFSVLRTDITLRAFSVKSTILLIETCTILTLSTVTFTFLVLFLEGVVTNYQAAFTIALITQIVCIIASPKMNWGSVFLPLSHTDIQRQLTKHSFSISFIQNIAEMLIVVASGLGVTQKRFEKIISED